MSDETTQFIVGDAAIDALSPRRRRRWFGRRKPERTLTHCENCEAPLTGPYCAQCGQHAIDYRRSLMQVMIDAADSFFDWDTKFLRSLGVLLVRPWQLTNDFNAGRRVRYMHPLRLYLLASILFFLLMRMINFADGPAPIAVSAEERAEIAASLGELTAPDSPLPPAERAAIDAARAKLLQDGGTFSRDERRTIAKATANYIRSSIRKGMKPEERAKLKSKIARLPREPGLNVSPEKAEPAVPATSPGPMGAATPTPSPKKTDDIHFSMDGNKQNTPFEKWMEGRIREKIGEDGTKGELFLETLRSHIPTMMLCAIPLFAFVLKILYIRQRRFYIEHLVYALHIHSFAYVGVVLIVLLGMALAQWSETARVLFVVALSITLLVQVFRSILRVYSQGWFFSTFKFLLGGIVYFFILAFGIAATAVITLLLPS